MGKDKKKDEKKKDRKEKKEKKDKKEKKKDRKKKEEKKKSPTVAQVIANLHAAIVANDWARVKSLFHPEFERYVFGHFHEELVQHQGPLNSSLAWLWSKGTFLQFDFSLPIGDVKAKGEAVFRARYRYMPHGSNLVFSNVHLVHIRISKTGLITFTDGYYDQEILDQIIETILTLEGDATDADKPTAAPAAAVPGKEDKGKGEKTDKKKKNTK